MARPMTAALTYPAARMSRTKPRGNAISPRRSACHHAPSSKAAAGYSGRMYTLRLLLEAE